MMKLRCALKTCVWPIALSVVVLPAASGSALPSPGGAPLAAPVDDARYTVSPEVGRPRTEYVATLRNGGLSTIEYGNAFAIAVRHSGGWRRLRHSRRCAWTSEAYILRPGDSATQSVGWVGRRCRYRSLEPGTYRVSKRIRFTEGGGSSTREKVVRAVFRVMRD